MEKRITLIVERERGEERTAFIDGACEKIYTVYGGVPLKDQATYRLSADGRIELAAEQDGQNASARRVTLTIEKTRKHRSLFIDETLELIWTTQSEAPLRDKATYRLSADGRIELVEENK